MSTPTIADQAAVLRLTRSLAADFPHLPAGRLQVDSICPNELTMSFHSSGSSFGGFEAWREALAIDPDSVTHSLQSGDMTAVLCAVTERDGVRVELVAYGPNLPVALAVAS